MLNVKWGGERGAVNGGRCNHPCRRMSAENTLAAGKQVDVLRIQSTALGHKRGCFPGLKSAVPQESNPTPCPHFPVVLCEARATKHKKSALSRPIP